ncbi:MAG TPA: VWA domain-containing protein [Chloroflexota bacterium]
MRYTYSRWNGTQDLGAFDADELMEALADDLMSDGDLSDALQRVMRWGLRHGDEQRALGTQHLLQRLRSQRQAELERYDLDSMVQDIKERIDDIVRSEREDIRRRLENARSQEPTSADDASAALETIAVRKEELLRSMPEEPGSAITSLGDYEFLSETARAKFDALMDMLRRQVLQTHFRAMRESLQSLTRDDIEDMAMALHDLNELVEDQAQGYQPDFTQFMARHGQHFPSSHSLEEVLANMQEQAMHTESLLTSMAPEMRRSLEDAMQSVLDHRGLRREMDRLAQLLQGSAAVRPESRQYPFSGDESLSLEEAMRLMRRMHDLDLLEKALKQAQDTGDISLIDSNAVERLMGEESGEIVERMKQLGQILEDAGYVARNGDSLELTARGIRRIGQKALEDIFRHLDRDAFGNHAVSVRGIGGDRIEETKAYEFGDAFLLDLSRTVMNAVIRDAPANAVQLSVSDFEIFKTEHLTQSATVLMLDMSRSMPLRGCFVAAKKVALALNSLIRTQFPRDHLYVVGFSDYARQLRPEALHQVTWGEYVYGTNMQHGFLLARRLLGRHKTGNRQIILITDGEPTAYVEEDRVHFSYPPSFRTFQETLREVKRCTQEGIVINTFMLERSHYLADFVNQMTRINRGRAFFATPERLGDYVLVDYVNQKRAVV